MKKKCPDLVKLIAIYLILLSLWSFLPSFLVLKFAIVEGISPFNKPDNFLGFYLQLQSFVNMICYFGVLIGSIQLFKLKYSSLVMVFLCCSVVLISDLIFTVVQMFMVFSPIMLFWLIKPMIILGLPVYFLNKPSTTQEFS